MRAEAKAEAMGGRGEEGGQSEEGEAREARGGGGCAGGREAGRHGGRQLGDGQRESMTATATGTSQRQRQNLRGSGKRGDEFHKQYSNRP